MINWKLLNNVSMFVIYYKSLEVLLQVFHKKIKLFLGLWLDGVREYDLIREREFFVQVYLAF